MSKKSGFYWHVHHDTLLEWCYDYDERADFILKHKDASEQPTRLRLLQPVKSKLPQEVVEADQACDKAWQACYKTKQAYFKAGQVYDEVRQVYLKAWRVYQKAGQAYEKVLADNKEAIEKLHALECPNCPWDGNTIFPADQAPQ